jgi:hypothetical protein
MIITDEGAQNDYRVNSPAGDYGILKIKEYKIEKWDAETNTISDVCVIDAEKVQEQADANPTLEGSIGSVGSYDRKVGLVYYQAGVVAVTPYVFIPYIGNSTSPADSTWATATNDNSRRGKVPPAFDPVSDNWWDSGSSSEGIAHSNWTSCSEDDIVNPPLAGPINGELLGVSEMIPGKTTVTEAWQEAPIDSSTGGDSNATGFRRRMVRMAFNNTTELNSTIYFARLNNNEFNYSANPTYLNESKIRVKETTLDAPVSYITSVGLYSADNELLAQAKLSEPVRKDPTNEFVLRVRLDY